MKWQLFGFLSKLLAPWWGITFRNSRQVHRFILCLNYMMFPLVCSPIPRNVYCLICDHRRVFVDRYRMICLVLHMTRGGTLWIFGHKFKDQGLLWHTNLLNRVDMLQSTIWVHVWNLMLKLLTRRGWSPFFYCGSRCQGQLRYFVCENFWARYKLVLCNHFQIPSC